MKYSVIFLDLDNTVYDFSASSREAYGEVYRAMDYDRFFPSFDAYMALYETRNAELWTLYNAGRITKDELNAERYLHPLRVMGVEGAEKGVEATEAFFRSIGMPTSIPELIGRQATDEEIATLVDKCSRGGKMNIGAMEVLNPADMKAIYQLANG